MHPDNLVKRHLALLVRALGLKGGLHAFPHGNASALDELGVPMKMPPGTTWTPEPAYHDKVQTHKIVDADVQLAEKLDDMFCHEPAAQQKTMRR